jgi:hypothetical protein
MKLQFLNIYYSCIYLLAVGKCDKKKNVCNSFFFIFVFSRGLIKRETLGLITMPLILIKVTMPLLLSRTRRPLTFFARSYVPRLIVCIFIAIFVFFGSRLQLYPTVFYVLLITLLGLDDALVYMQGAARGGFFASISDPRIGSTYYTLIASLSNAGSIVSSSIVLYTANWLPKEQSYYIEVGVCILLGCVWLCASWRLIQRLQTIPVDRWHLSVRKSQLTGQHHDRDQMMDADIRKSELPTFTADMEVSSWM